MKKGLTDKELKELQRIFCPRDIELILSKFSLADIRKVLNGTANDK